LRIRGVSAKQLRNKFGHNLEALLGELIDNRGFLFDKNSLIKIKIANKYYDSKQYEYPRTGYKELPDLGELKIVTELMLGKALFDARQHRQFYKTKI